MGADGAPPPNGRRPISGLCLFISSSGGRLSTAVPSNSPPSRYLYDPADPVPTIGGNFSDPRVAGLFHCGAFDQRGRTDLMFCRDVLPLSQRADVLVFESEPITREVVLSGPVVARLFVSSSAPDTDFTVKIVDVHPPNPDYPDGFAMNLADSVLRMRFRDGFDREVMIEPGQILKSKSMSGQSATGFRRDTSYASKYRAPITPNSIPTQIPASRWAGSVPGK